MTDPLTAARAAIPTLACKGLCQNSCGPVAWSRIEAESWSDNGIAPPTTVTHPKHGILTCSHLTDAGKCGIYDHRPLVCRLYGNVLRMACEHGCRPEPMFMDDHAAYEALQSLGPLAGSSMPGLP